MTLLEHPTEPPEPEPDTAPEPDLAAPDYPAWLETELEHQATATADRYTHELHHLTNRPPPEPPPPIRLAADNGQVLGPHITGPMYDAILGPVTPTPTTVPPVSELGRVHLTPLLSGDHQPIRPFHMRRDDNQGILYPGAIHAFTGEPAVGKTWFGHIANAAILTAGGSITVLDYESSAPVFIERMRALEIPDDILADPTRVAYYNIPGKLNPPRVAELVAEIDHQTAALVTIDAMLPALARQGLDDNSNTDFAAYLELICRPLAAVGTAILLIDHVTKDPATRARGARGASSKLQLVDVSYSLRLVKAFSKTRAGIVKLICEKDRYGTYAIGENVAEIHIAPDGDHAKAVSIKAPAATDEPFRPTVLMERVSKALEDFTNLNARTLREAVKGDDHAKDLAIRVLEEEGYVTRRRQGREVLFSSLKAYREDSET